MAGKMKRRVPPPPPKEADDSPLDPHELDMMVSRTIRFGDVYRLKGWLDQLDKENLYTDGSVERHSNHYVHEKTTDFEFNVDLEAATKQGVDITPEEKGYGYALVDKAVEDISQIVIHINRAIYKSLEAEYTYQFQGEGAIESIRANNYTFNAEGERKDEGDTDDEGNEVQVFTYDQLPDDQAKEKAVEWYGSDTSDDFWSEYTLDDWKEFLTDMGFGYDTDHVEIGYSGFWSQGDGASFTCKTFDFAKFCEGLSNPELRSRIYGES